VSPEEQKRLGAFLRAKAEHSVHSYLGLRKNAKKADCASAIEKRRVWAQAQQTNPKFQDEAIWVLSNLDVLEEALRCKKEDLLWLDATPAEDTDLEERSLYTLLGVSQTATPEQIQDAHRLLYRDARHLKNRHEAHRLYAQLDEAWRVLGDPELRAEYDSSQESEPVHKLPDETPKQTFHFDQGQPTEKQALTDAPALKIRGKTPLAIILQRRVVEEEIRLERIGPGLVDAILRCDQPWLSAKPERLDPHASSQKIRIRVDPEGLAGRSGLGQVIVQNFNGQRLSIHVRVTRERVNQKRLLLILLFFVSLIGASLLFAPTKSLFFSESTVVSQNAVLLLDVSPVKATVRINDTTFPPNTHFKFDALPNRPFQLTVEADGFQRHSERLEIRQGRERRHRVELKPLSAEVDR